MSACLPMYKNMSILHVLIVVNLFTIVLSVCPAGWAQNNGQCFYIFTDKLNKADAVTRCYDNGAQLVYFTDESQWMYISSLIESVQLDTGVWTALTFDDGNWTWSGFNYTELYHWKNTQDGTSNPHYVPQPDTDHGQAQISLVDSHTFLFVELASTQLYTFCVRDFNDKDLCDTDENWTNLLHKCHKSYPPATWLDAVSTCTDQGGQVFSPGGPEEFIPADALVNATLNVWIGASYKFDGYYYQVDNTPVTFLPWIYPNSSYYDPNKTCIAFQHSDGVYGYYMSSCLLELSFVCTRPIGSCPLGWYQEGMQCLQLHIRPEEMLTWFMAVDYCRSHNSEIAQDLSKDANTVLYNLLQENEVHLAWLGFSGSDGTYKDMKGNKIWGNYYLFDTTITSGGPASCGVTDFDPRRNGLSLASYCYTPQPFVCTIDISLDPHLTVTSNMTCDNGWIPFSNQCYRVVMSPKTYNESVEHCQSLEASIFHVNNTMEQSFFSTLTFMSYGLQFYWIGVQDASGTNSFIFPETGEQSQFWNLNPTYNSSIGPCIYVSSGTNSEFIGAWSADNCDATHNFVCQKSGELHPFQEPSPETTTWYSQCGVGWLYDTITNQCYFVSPYLHKSWQEAREDCQSREGDLISITGDLVQATIEKILQSNTYANLEESLWIGAGDMTETYGWGWSDQQAFSFIYWAEGHPQYASDDGDNCGYVPVTQLTFRWKARSCEDRLGFICGKPASSPPEDQQSTFTPASCIPQPLISGVHSILFPQDFSASSSKDAQHVPEQSRVTLLNSTWSPANNSIGQWLGVTFHSPVTIVSIQLKGEDLTGNYVSKFKVQFQYDELSPWYWYTNPDRSVKVFDGVTQPHSSMSVFLFGEIYAHAIRIWPVEWNQGISLQLELTGCPEVQCQAEYAMSGPLFIDDNNIKVSSQLPGFESWNARLSPTKDHQNLSAWMPSPDDKTPWIEVDLGQTRILTGITLAGANSDVSFEIQFLLILSKSPAGEYVTYTQPYGQSFTFSCELPALGKTTTISLQFGVETRIVRLLLINWQQKNALKFDLLVCSIGCTADAMFASLPNIELTALDSRAYHTPDRSKLNTQIEGDELDGWAPVQPDNVDACYIQADLGTVMQVKAVATQGSQSESSWVTSYYLAFSTDGITFRRFNSNVATQTSFTTNNVSMVYKGNFDVSTVVKNELPQPVNARYVQLWPHEFNKAIALRWEIFACSKHTANTALGCYTDDPTDPDLPYVQPTEPFAFLWPESCLSFCYDKGYLFAGLQGGVQCSCGNSYGMYGVAVGCNIACQYPYENFTCGGQSQNMVYSTGISADSYLCPAGWISFRDSCYSLMKPATLTNAGPECQAAAAHLVDISDKDENDLVASTIRDKRWDTPPYNNIGQDVWIGLTGLKDRNYDFQIFGWTSGTIVNFTNWGHHQPLVNPGLQQNGVIMSSDGSWSNTFDEEIHAVMCETAKKPSNNSVTNSPSVGCLPEWHGGNTKCYSFYRQKKVWADARDFCLSQNSTLARADSSTENLALISSLSILDGRYWLDVSDVNQTGLYTHTSAMLDVVYSNWASQKPDSSGTCVSVGTGESAGDWINEDCEITNRFVCEMPRIGYLPPKTISPSNNLPCPQGWDLHGTLCYQFNIAANSMLTWHEANENCVQQGATLASFHSDNYYDALVSKFSQNTGNFWIGLNNLDTTTGFKWSDGSVMNFVRWGQGQPRQPQTLSFCGEILLDTHTMGLQVCTEMRNWMCSVKKGQNVTNITEEIIPPPEIEGACRPLNGNWYKYKDYCYYVSSGDGETDDALTWRESQQWCQKQGAELASVTSRDENAFIRGRLNQGIPVEAAWIGLNELDRSGGYSWSDGSVLGTWIMNWDVNEPDDYNGFEACVEMLARNGKWNDDHCSIKQGFVCKQPAPGANITKPQPPQAHTGNCPPNFCQLGYKCYIVKGQSGKQDRSSWTEARRFCQSLKPGNSSDYIDLASIASEEENAFLTTLMTQYKMDAWVGLRRLSGGQFMWADNEDFVFKNWGKDEPNMAPGNDSCVYIYGSTNSVGEWSDVPCEDKNAFICQGFVEPSYPTSRIPPSPLCNITDGFQQFGTSCYKIFNQTKTWQDAKASCSQSKAYLATIMDGFDWSEMYLFSHNFSNGVWIGLNDLATPGLYTWDSDFPVTYTKWAHHQPKDNGGCVYMDADGLFHNDQCSEVRAFVCRSDATPPKQVPAGIVGFCDDQEFFLFGSTCYLVVHDAQFTYDMAGEQCEQRGATLATITTDSPTFDLIDKESVWIGLTDSLTEGFSWEDSSVLSYTNWAPDKPAWKGDDSVEDGCVVMLTDGTWSNVDCENKNGFLCSLPATPYSDDFTSASTSVYSKTSSVVSASSYTTQRLPTTKSSAPSTKAQTHTTVRSSSKITTKKQSTSPVYYGSSFSSGLTGGQTAGIVIGVLVVVVIFGIIVFVIYRKGGVKSSFLRREASRVRNFENSLYAETRKDTLTRSDHIEGINIFALDDDPRKFSVSYSVLQASEEVKYSSRDSTLMAAHQSGEQIIQPVQEITQEENDSSGHFGYSKLHSADDADYLDVKLEVS